MTGYVFDPEIGIEVSERVSARRERATAGYFPHSLRVHADAEEREN